MANKRILKKHASQAVKRLANSLTVEQLSLKVEQLQIEKVKLQSLLEQARSESAKKTRRIAKLESQLKQTKSNVKILSTNLTKATRTVRTLKIQTMRKEKRLGFGKQPQSKPMTLDESMTLRKPAMIARFIERLREQFEDAKYSQLVEIQSYLLQMSWQDVRDLIKWLNLEKAYYNSENYFFNDTYKTFDSVYTAIMFGGSFEVD